VSRLRGLRTIHAAWHPTHTHTPTHDQQTMSPVVRIALRPYPKARDMVFGSLIAFFLCHGAWLIGRGFNERQEQQKRLVALWDAEQRRQREEQL